MRRRSRSVPTKQIHEQEETAFQLVAWNVNKTLYVHTQFKRSRFLRVKSLVATRSIAIKKLK